MADHEYTSENPENNVCENEIENIVITEPAVISAGSDKKTSGSLKSEIIREFNQFLLQDDIKHMDREEAKKYGVDLIHICVLFSCELQTRIPYINTIQYEISIDDEVTIEDKRTIRFKYAHTATRDNIIHVKGFCKGFDCHVLVFAQKDKNIIYEKDILEEEDFYFKLDQKIPSGTYIISIWTIEKKTISVKLKVWKEDVIDKLIDARGAAWINSESIVMEEILGVRGNRRAFDFVKLRWYLSKESVGFLMDVLERMRRGESEETIWKAAYESGLIKNVGFAISIICLFTGQLGNYICWLLGTTITIGEPESCEKMYWTIDKVTGRYREGGIEKFKNGCIFEVSDSYIYNAHQEMTASPSFEINSIDIRAWNNSQDPMEGQLGYRGDFISHDDPGLDKEIKKCFETVAKFV